MAAELKPMCAVLGCFNCTGVDKDGKPLYRGVHGTGPGGEDLGRVCTAHFDKNKHPYFCGKTKHEPSGGQPGEQTKGHFDVKFSGLGRNKTQKYIHCGAHAGTGGYCNSCCKAAGRQKNAKLCNAVDCNMIRDDVSVFCEVHRCTNCKTGWGGATKGVKGSRGVVATFLYVNTDGNEEYEYTSKYRKRVQTGLCRDCKCRTPSCGNSKVDGSEACAECHCKNYPKCSKRCAGGAGGFCGGCNCRVKGCKRLKIDGSIVCESHRCEQPHCSNAALNRSRYCTDCKCQVRSCPRLAIDGNPVCETHQCKQPHCLEQTKDESMYCWNCGCNSYQCALLKSANSKFCVNHRCSASPCPSERWFTQNFESEYCSACKCQGQGLMCPNGVAAVPGDHKLCPSCRLAEDEKSGCVYGG